MAVRADSVVVFNEIMYHPESNEPLMEWVELHNQMSVNVDLSRWSIQGGIEYRFPEGTVIPGRDYLVVAISPGTLEEATGLTNVLGPFSGRLANSGERLDLVNNSGRLMDSISYGVEGAWPVAPDGSGVSLAKRNEDQASGEPAHWTASALTGGTPGRRNFALNPYEVKTTSPISMSSTWRYEASDPELGTEWRQPTYDDTSWAFGPATFLAGDAELPTGEPQPLSTLFSTGTGTDGKALSPGTADPHYWLISSAHSQPPPPAIRATVIQPHPAWTPNNTSASWIGPVNPGTTDVAPGFYRYRTEFDLQDFSPLSASLSLSIGVDDGLEDVLLNGVPTGLQYGGFSTMSGWFSITNGFVPGVNTLEFVTRNQGTAKTPAGLRVLANGTARAKITANTLLGSVPVTSWFRSSFVLDAPPASSGLELRALVSDGAVFYLNGLEVLRINMPPGPVDASTPAVFKVPNAAWSGPYVLPVEAMVRGTNSLAVEVHSADNGNNLAFAVSLVLNATNYLIPPLTTLAVNEMASGTNADFFLELLNYGSNAIHLDGFVLSRHGGAIAREFALPGQVLAPGAFLTLTRSEFGFGADPGDRFFLYAPGKESVVDAVVVERRAKARHPDGLGAWLVPAVATPSATNRFNLSQDIVFNEIMYHAPPLPSAPDNHEVKALVSFSDVWKHYALGRSPGEEWKEVNFDDEEWGSGEGVFYNTTAFLAVPKQTELPLVTADGQRIVTWYFRRPLVLDMGVKEGELQVYLLVDDGAVFYLNEVEIFRYNMPAGEVRYDTLATPGVATPVLQGPFTIAVSNLVAGTNLLAVEVHQFTTNPIAADMVFGTEIGSVLQFTPGAPRRKSSEQWLELHNRGTNTVDVSGWSIQGDIAAVVAADTTISAGGFLVLAKDIKQMNAGYPEVPVAGVFSKNLSRRSGLLRLLDRHGNPADQVHYFDGGTWPELADGGGSSLELRDPRADNSKSGAWGASERSGAAWNNYVYRAVASNPLGPTKWNELVIGLLDAGECLIDDLRVVESPDTARRDLLQNGNFEVGLTAWRALGNHARSRIEPDPDRPGNQVLRLVATGPTEHLHNHLETTLANGAAVVNGRVYEISFRAKWLGGNNLLNTRLYFNRVARTTELAMPRSFGTPGAPNSILTTNSGPTFEGVFHTPVIPVANEPVVITARVSDPDGLGPVDVHWRWDNGQWQRTAMTARERLDTSGYVAYEATLPGQGSGKLVQFYVQANDTKGVVSLFPPEGPDSRALYRVDAGEPLMPQLHRIRMLMTAADAALLHAATNVMSNDRFKLTMIYDEREVFYNVGTHLQGSERGRHNPAGVGFSIRFNPEQLFRGVQDSIVIDRNGGPAGIGGKQEEILLWHAVNHAGGGLHGLDCDLVQIIPPRASDHGPGLLRMSAFDSEYFDNLFVDGGDGELYTLELIYYPLTTLTGDPESPKLPQPDEVLNVDIQDRGSDPESYRWIFLKEDNRALDNYRRVIALNQAFSLGTAELQDRIGEYIDVDQWMRALAFKAFNGDPDTFTYGLNHNWLVYFPPGNGPALGLLWDMDLSYLLPVDYSIPGRGSATMNRIMALPDSSRRYYHHLSDLARTTMNAAHLGPWAAHYSGLLGQDWSKVVEYLQRRVEYVQARLPKPVSFAIMSNQGAHFAVNTNRVTLTGTASLGVHELRINGIPNPVKWTSLSNWVLTVTLPARVNALTVMGYDSWGYPVANAADFIIVTNLSSPNLAPVVVNEWMADNAGPGGVAEPLDGGFADWFELYNPNEEPVDLSGYYLSDSLAEPAKWQVPSGAWIGAKGFLLVWADGAPEKNGQGPFNDLHASFQLNRSGEAIAVFSPDGRLQHAVVFGEQRENVSQGLFPDGQTNSVQFMENWTPRASNQVGPPPAPEITGYLLSPNGTLRIQSTVLPGRSYQVEYIDSLEAVAWLPLGKPFRPSAPTSVIETGPMEQPQRFYRVVLVR
jgi:hypothetical protein